MKKLTAILLSVVMLLGLTACGGKEKTETSVLKVGMECDYAPYNWSQKDDSNGAVAIKNVSNMYANGYDVQVAKKIAESLGKTLEIYSYEWDGLVPAVQSGKLDMVIAGMSPTSERREKIDFSDIYYNSNLVIVTKEGGLSDVKTIADLDGKKIAAQFGTSHYEALSTQTKATVQESKDFSEMFLALKANSIDGYVAEEPTALSICNQNKGYSYVPLVNNDTGFKVPVEDTSIAVGVKKGSDLLSKINEYLSTFKEADQKELMSKMTTIAPNDDEN